jgi:hypothetical protein
MHESDKERLEFSKQVSQNMPTVSRLLYTSIKWPVKFFYPMFEARAAYCVPNNYFQNLYVDDEKCGVMFSHGSMRSIFFADGNLMLFSKTVNHLEGREFFTSFILAHFNSNEFSFRFEGDNLTITVNTEKKMKNLVTGKIENKRISFNFVNQSVKNRIMPRDKVLTSMQFKAIYEKYGTVANKVASIDLEGYAITVPHFSPHPYLLQIHKELGFESNRDFQEHVIDYFRSHLTESAAKN